jgi:hypothetical protein
VPAGYRFRTGVWAASSTAILVGILLALLAAHAFSWLAGFWLSGLGLYFIGLVSLAFSTSRSVRRLLATVASAVVLEVATVAVAAQWSYERFGDRLEATEWVVVSAFFLGFLGWLLLVVPLVVALHPFFRSSVLGSPVLWSRRLYTGADEDAAAEDFGIY